MMKRNLALAGAATMLAISGMQQASAEWRTVCEQKKCQLHNEVKNSANKVLARMYVQRLRDDDGAIKKIGAVNKVIAIINLPLGLHIPAGVGVKIDDTPVFPAQLLDCTTKVGCRAAFVPPPATLKAMETGKSLTVSIMDSASRKKIHYAFLMEGFALHLNTFHRPKP